MNIIDNNFLKIAIILSGFALFQPAWFIWIKPHIPLFLGVIMFGMGITLEFKDLKRIWKRPQYLALGLVFQFVLMPIIAFCIGKTLNLSSELFIGLIIVGACPGGTASNVITYLARANLALSITLTLISTLLAPLVTPFIILFLLHEKIDINVILLMKTTFWIVLFPLIDGLLIRQFFQKQLTPVLHIFPSISIIAITVIIACVIGLNQKILLDLPILMMIAVVLHNGLGLVVGYGFSTLFKFPVSTARTLSIETGMQNSGLGVALATAHFSPLAALPGALFSFWHNFSGIILAKYWSHHAVSQIDSK
jgi:BASS family bile acid:Na+ symporter